jgi:hypothetical protein
MIPNVVSSGAKIFIWAKGITEAVDKAFKIQEETEGIKLAAAGRIEAIKLVMLIVLGVKEVFSTTAMILWNIQ